MTVDINDSKMKIAILGGTGKEGKGLAYRWAKKGHEIYIGSRQEEKAQKAAEEVLALLDQQARISGSTNENAAKMADVLVLTVPYIAHRTILESIKHLAVGKVLIDVTVPLVPPKVTKVQMPEAGSASLEAKQILGEEAEVITAFQNISHELLLSDTEPECDVLICGSSKYARDLGIRLAEDAGLMGWDAGPLENSMVVEGFTSILIGLNKRYGVHSSGIRITGIERS